MNLRFLSTVLAVMALAASCTSGTEGIFASLEREQKIVSSGGLSIYASVTSMAQFGTQYFATGGRYLFSRSTDPGAKQWSGYTVGGNPSVQSVGASGSRLFAVAGGTLYQSTNGSTWSTVSGLASTDTAFSLVPVRNGDGVTTNQLIVVTTSTFTDASGGTGNTYSNIYLIKNGTLTGSFVLRNNFPTPTNELGAPVIAAANDKTDGTGQYYLASASFLWRWDGAATNVAPTVAPVTTDIAGMIYLNTSSTLYVSTGIRSGTTSGGGLYASSVAQGAAPTSWTTLQTGVTYNSLPVAFGQFLYNSVNSSLWIATGYTTITNQGTGYMEMTVPGNSFSTSPTTSTNNYSSSAIPTYAVGALFLGTNSDTSQTYFLGTLAHGLWTWSASPTQPGTGSSANWSQQ